MAYKSDDDRLTIEQLQAKYGDRGKIVAVRVKPGDWQTLVWLQDQLGMTKADVVRRALIAYAAQVATMKRTT